MEPSVSYKPNAATWFGGNGTSDYLNAGDTTPWNPGGAFTIFLRVFTISYGTVVSKWGGTPDRSLLFDTSATGITWNILGTTLDGYGVTTGGFIRTGEWESIAVDASGSLLQGWTQGIMRGSAGQGGNIVNSTLNAVIGTRIDLPNPFKGYIADVATWDAVLTANEHAALAAGASPLIIRAGSISSYYPLITTQSALASQTSGNSLTTNGSVAVGVTVDAGRMRTAASIKPPAFQSGMALFPISQWGY